MDFTKKDMGVYADGTFGIGHRRQVLAGLVRNYDPVLARELRDEPSDDFSEEDDALDLLQKHTADGLTWVIDDDLILADDNDLEDNPGDDDDDDAGQEDFEDNPDDETDEEGDESIEEW